MTVAIALFTSDLRVHDNPVLWNAVRAGAETVPLFVRDRRVSAAGFDVPNRRAFLADCLADLDAELGDRGGRLVVRSGDVVAETCRLAHQTSAGEVHVAAGVSAFARRREEDLRGALASEGRALRVHDAVVTVLPPGAVTPQGRDHFAVFTPYFRRWSAQERRTVLAAPRRLRVPDGVNGEPLPRRGEVVDVSPSLPVGGEREGRRALARWLRGGLRDYARRQDELAHDGTSRLSAHLHFGTLSPTEVVHRCGFRTGAGADAYLRQLAWRDFHHQVLAARPEAAHRDYRSHQDRWRSAEGDAAAWREGRTGYPVVDAAMRQLRHEGWLHNRARLLVASFLTKTLYLDWRIGARHFLDWLVDGDIANNQLNWQWAAGTGTDTRPNRVLNPLVQARRFDPDGAYVRRWLPELADLDGSAAHQPWKHGHRPPMVDLAQARARFDAARSGDQP